MVKLAWAPTRPAKRWGWPSWAPPGAAPVVAAHSARKRAFVDAVVGALLAVAVGDLVAEDAALADLGEGAGDSGEAAGDGVGAGVVVDDGGDAAEGRAGAADEGAEVDGLVVEGAVELPPELLEDLDKVLGGLLGRRHPDGEGGVEVVVADDQAGDDEAASGGVAVGGGGFRGGGVEDFGDEAVLDAEGAVVLDLDGVEAEEGDVGEVG